jgi:hypothetical protein
MKKEINKKFITTANKIIEKLTDGELHDKNFVVEYMNFDWRLKMNKVKSFFEQQQKAPIIKIEAKK